MGAFQLPDSVLWDAIGCLIYSFSCLIANSILIWLIWTHNEKKTYIAFIAYFTLIATYSSIIQQLYDYIYWRDIMIKQFFYGRENAHDAEVQYQQGIFGLKLVLSYIRIFSFVVSSTYVFFLSFSLAATVYGWWAKKSQALRVLSMTGRVVPIALALVSIILLRLEFTHESFMAYMFAANAQFVLSLLGACIFLIMILFKYLQTRRQLKTWTTVQYGKVAASTGVSGHTSNRSRAYSNKSSQASGTFDSWLVTRLTIALLVLCVFEYTNIGPRLSAKGRVVESAYESEPDLSRKRALSTVRGYLSGVSPSLLGFIVFGTTKAFQKKMYRTFVPKFLRKDEEDDFRCRHASNAVFDTNNSSSYARASTLPPSSYQPPNFHSLSHSQSRPSIRKPEPVRQLMPIREPARPSRGGQPSDVCHDEVDLEIGNLPRSPVGHANPANYHNHFREESYSSRVPISRFHHSMRDKDNINTTVWSETSRPDTRTSSRAFRQQWNGRTWGDA